MSANGIESRSTNERKFVEPGRVLEGVGAVGVVRPSAVRAELLDHLLGAERAAGDHLGDVVQGVMDRRRAGEGLDGALADEDDAGDERDRQEDVEDAADEVDPEVPDRRRPVAGESPDERDRDGDPDRGGGEVLDGEGAHLRQVRHRRLARIVLPVRVRDERDRRVEAERRADRPEMLGVERQRPLQPDHPVDDEDGDGGVGDERSGVALPALLDLGVDADEPVDRPFDEGKVPYAALVDRGHVRAEESPDQDHDDREDDDHPCQIH